MLWWKRNPLRFLERIISNLQRRHS
jgi:hypothetical protein